MYMYMYMYNTYQPTCMYPPRNLATCVYTHSLHTYQLWLLITNMNLARELNGKWNGNGMGMEQEHTWELFDTYYMYVGQNGTTGLKYGIADFYSVG